MARLDARWENFSERGQTWDHFWQDASVAADPVVVLPPAAALTLTGATPVVLTPRVTLPTAASLTVSGAVPVISTPRVAQPSASSLTLTGATPAVLAPRAVQPAFASLTLTGAVPTVEVAGSAIVLPTPASLVLTGAVPDTGMAQGSHRVGPRFLRQLPRTAPKPVSAEPIPARLSLVGAEPRITVNDDDLALVLAA